MKELLQLIGREESMALLLDRVRLAVTRFEPRRVGAYQVTCSDEAEWECAHAFQLWFAERMLPDLKPGSRSPMRTINLGARYEPGTLRVVESHYAPGAGGNTTVIVVKINSHVGVVESDGGIPRFGVFQRYGEESACCGALTALLTGAEDVPAIEELRGTFNERRTRLAALSDPAQVPKAERLLHAAVAESRLQARRAVADATQFRPSMPTHFLVLSSVSVNRPGPDTEILVAVDHVDWTGDAARMASIGLGDDPAGYRVDYDLGKLVLADEMYHPGQSPIEQIRTGLSEPSVQVEPPPSVDSPPPPEQSKPATGD